MWPTCNKPYGVFRSSLRLGQLGLCRSGKLPVRIVVSLPGVNVSFTFAVKIEGGCGFGWLCRVMARDEKRRNGKRVESRATGSSRSAVVRLDMKSDRKTMREHGRNAATACQFVNQFPLAVGHSPSGGLASVLRHVSRAVSRTSSFDCATQDFGGDLTCAFY